MRTKEHLVKNEFPVINIEQLRKLFAELILWYDSPVCKSINDAYEIVDEYLMGESKI